MVKNYHISIFLDTRHEKEGKLFPVKLRVYMPQTKKVRLYATKFDLNEKEFNSAWTLKPRSEFKDLKLKLQAIEQAANEIADKLNPFSFEAFGKKMGYGKAAGLGVLSNYKAAMETCNKAGRIGSASAYEQSLNSLGEFLNYRKDKDINNLTLRDITQEWLVAYEHYMVKKKNRTKTTVGIYLRSLRAVFNSAIAEGDIDKDLYPFGVKRYQIPTGNNIKKALKIDELKILINAKPGTADQKKARDFFFFSYGSNGMNLKDVALLRNRDVDKDQFTFIRAKTMNTAKKPKNITCYLTDFTRRVIKDYGNIDKDKNNYVFDIINDKMTDLEKHLAIKNFTRYVNQHIKLLAMANGLTTDISLYWARHSYATNAITTAGASMEFVMEALGHQNMGTTMDYFAGFADLTKKGVTNKLMEF